MQDREQTSEEESRGAVDGLRFALRALLRAAKHAPDRVLHHLRRRNLRLRLGRNGLPRSIVFICTGNICRSPYAAHRFAATLPDALRSYMTVGSAGFIGPDRGTPNNGLTAASARGIDLREHRSHVITAEIVRDVDLLVVMEPAQAARLRTSFRASPDRIVMLGDLDPDPIDTRTVRDPIFQPVQVFEQTYERIDRCIRELYHAIAGDHALDEFAATEPVAPDPASETAVPDHAPEDEDSGPAPAPEGLRRSLAHDPVASARH